MINQNNSQAEDAAKPSENGSNSNQKNKKATLPATNAPPIIRHNIFPKGVKETGIVIDDGYTMVKLPRTPSCLFEALALAILGNLDSDELKKNIARTVRAN